MNEIGDFRRRPGPPPGRSRRGRNTCRPMRSVYSQVLESRRWGGYPVSQPLCRRVRRPLCSDARDQLRTMPRQRNHRVGGGVAGRGRCALAMK